MNYIFQSTMYRIEVLNIVKPKCGTLVGYKGKAVLSEILLLCQTIMLLSLQIVGKPLAYISVKLCSESEATKEFYELFSPSLIELTKKVFALVIGIALTCTIGLVSTSYNFKAHRYLKLLKKFPQEAESIIAWNEQKGKLYQIHSAIQKLEKMRNKFAGDDINLKKIGRNISFNKLKVRNTERLLSEIKANILTAFNLRNDSTDSELMHISDPTEVQNFDTNGNRIKLKKKVMKLQKVIKTDYDKLYLLEDKLKINAENDRIHLKQYRLLLSIKDKHQELQKLFLKLKPLIEHPYNQAKSLLEETEKELELYKLELTEQEQTSTLCQDLQEQMVQAQKMYTNLDEALKAFEEQRIINDCELSKLIEPDY